MVLHIEIPEDISRVLSERWGDMPRHVLETIAVEGYRSGVLTEHQVGRMLGLNGRENVAAFLGEHGVFPEYSDAELDRDLDAARRVAEMHDRERDTLSR